MCWPRQIRRSVTALAVFGLFASASFGDEPVLKLSGIPDRLAFPLAAGKNVVLTAKVSAAVPKTVWLAKTKNANLRIRLTRTAVGEYQVNLADEDVGTLLQAGKGRQFRVFAEMESGKVLQSVLVKFALASLRPSPLQMSCRVLGRGSDGDVHVADRFSNFSNWHQPSEVDKLEIHFVEEVEDALIRARADKKTWDFKFSEAEQVARLDVAGGIRKSWEQFGVLVVESRAGRAWQTVATLRAVPRKLDFPGKVATLTVHQRRSETVPGSHGYMDVELGDITAGQVLLNVRSFSGANLINTTSVRQGDALSLNMPDETYSLYVRQMVNVLIGNDFAVIDVSRLPASQLKSIDRLLKRLEGSDVTFVREGQQYNGREAAAHLRNKLAAAGPRVKTLEDFIDKMASRSSTSGKPHQVKLPDGSTVPAKQWLRQQAKKKVAPKTEVGAGPN